ncbi:hypothetical protein [Spirosoma flavum]|uniref:Uncharacterized protein n=1 Tax=Spirosoma flavum TaxID=2048557 RepID=A0ABW6AIS8_9BACT
MENVNQDAMLNEHPNQSGTDQTPDDSILQNEDYNPTDLAGDVNAPPTTPTDEQEAATSNHGSGAASGSPNMEPDLTNYSNGDALGNNDGTESDPEMTDPIGNS